MQQITHSIFPIIWVHSHFPRHVDPHSRVASYLRTLCLRSSSQNCYFWHIPFECRERCGGVLTMGSLPSSSVVSPQMEPKSGFWFGMLRTGWWERHPQADMGKYGEEKLMKQSYPASGTTAIGSNNIPNNVANNVGLECRKQKAKYIDCTNKNGTDLILGRKPWL